MKSILAHENNRVTELAVLSDLLSGDSTRAAHTMGVLTHWMFGDGDTRRYFQACEELFFKGVPLSVVEVEHLLKRRGAWSEDVDREGIVLLGRGGSTGSHLGSYLLELAHLGRMRVCADAAKEVLKVAEEGVEDPEEFAAKAMDILDFALKLGKSAAVEPWSNVVSQVMEMAEGKVTPPIPTAFGDLTAFLQGGFFPDDGFVVVGARPSVGKTSFAMQCIEAMARAGDPSILFSLEMSSRMIATRYILSLANVSLRNLRSGDISDDEKEKVSQACKEISGWPLYVFDQSITIEDIRNKCQQMLVTHGVKVVFIDYIQLCRTAKEYDGGYDRMTYISGQLKAMSRDLKIPIVALSQLNRGPAARAEKRPQISDLRESGALEQEADLCILLHREDYWKQPGEEMSNEAELIVAKNRNGPVGVVKLVWDAPWFREPQPYGDDHG